MVGQGWGSQLLPHLLPTLTGLAAVRRAMFRTVPQTRISYRGSALSEGQAGEVRGGDRLPWIGDSYAGLAGLDWCLRVYGSLDADLARAAAVLGMAVERFDWNDAAEQAGFGRDAAYLVRPDGHVALAMARQDVAALRAYAARIGLIGG